MKKKRQYSKIIVGVVLSFSLFMVLAAHAANFILIWNDKQAMTEETVATTTMFGGIASSSALAAYTALNAVRDWSRNKHCHGEEKE